MVHVAGVFPLFPVRPLIPYKFLECLHPRKRALGRAEAGRGLWSRGWGPPWPPLLTAGSSRAASPWQPVVAAGCRLLCGVAGKQFTPETRDPQAPFLLHPQQGGFLCFRRDVQTPKIPISQP